MYGENQGQEIAFAPGITSELDDTLWRVVGPTPSPLGSRNSAGQLSFPSWLGDAELAQGGVYLWLFGHEDRRFVHVGMSSTSVAERTRQHVKNAYTTDRVYGIEATSSDFPSLGPELRGSGLDVEEHVTRFLTGVGVLFLIPQCQKGRNALRVLEGVIARSAAHMFGHDVRGQWEITNSLSGTHNPRLSEPQMHQVASWLNSLVRMMPGMPRMHARDAALAE